MGRRTIPAYAAGGDRPRRRGRPRRRRARSGRRTVGATESRRSIADRLVAGGAALARHADGRVVFVRRRPARRAGGGRAPSSARVALRGPGRAGCSRPSPDRVEPRCPHVAAGCGGCDLQHAGAGGPAGPRRTSSSTPCAASAASPTPVVRAGPALSPLGLPHDRPRLAVVDGRVGFRRRPRATTSSPSITAWSPTRCSTSWSREGRFGDGRRGRAAGRGRDRRAPGGRHADRRRASVLPDDVAGGRRRRARGRPAGVDPRGGRRAPVAHLGRLVLPGPPRRRRGAGRGGRSMVADQLAVPGRPGRPRTLVDAYGGVGLFAGALLDGCPGWRAVAVEWSRSSVADARHNLADLDARSIGHAPIEHLRAPRGRRRGRRPGPHRARAAGGRTCSPRPARARLVLVSCDPASLGRRRARCSAAVRLPPRRVGGGRPLPPHPPRRGRLPLRPRLTRTRPRPARSVPEPAHPTANRA